MVSNSSIDSLGFALSISLFDTINGYNYGILSSKGWNVATLQQYRDIHGTYTRWYSSQVDHYHNYGLWMFMVDLSI